MTTDEQRRWLREGIRRGHTGLLDSAGVPPSLAQRIASAPKADRETFADLLTGGAMNASEMTCEQVNEAIARIRGTPVLDVCHDWAAAGMLLEEMTRVHQVRLNFDPQYISDKAYDQWLDGPTGADYPSAPRFYLPDLMLFYDGDMGDPPAGDVLPEAIARAYYAWRAEGK